MIHPPGPPGERWQHRRHRRLLEHLCRGWLRRRLRVVGPRGVRRQKPPTSTSSGGMESEENPDSLGTRSSLGITLGPGFTGAKLAHVMRGLHEDNPEVYQRLFGDVGIEVTAKRYGNYDVTLTIPLDDLDTSTALMKHDEEPIPGNLQYGMNLPADEAWDIVRKDVKLLGLVALAAHTREFAQY